MKVKRPTHAEAPAPIHLSGPDSKKPSIAVVHKYSLLLTQLKEEMGKALIGQEHIVDALLRALICDGHVLIEGVPGIAKTLAIKTLGKVSGCTVSRIQFTADLLPSDIIGVTTYTPQKGFETSKGPIFANFVIADEVNRTPPKTQSALIEAMQERQVTIGKESFPLPSPFFVMANQNPIENAGVYTLPEAQIDRFIFKLLMQYPHTEEELLIMEQNTTTSKFEDLVLKPIVTPKEIMAMQEVVKSIYFDDKIKRYVLAIVQKTRERNFMYGEFIEWGCSPRASIALFIAAKARAFMKGRNFVTPADVKDVAHDVLRHRLILSYRSRAEGVTPDMVISRILEKEVPAP